jgi:hypothetical protein
VKQSQRKKATVKQQLFTIPFKGTPGQSQGTSQKKPMLS